VARKRIALSAWPLTISANDARSIAVENIGEASVIKLRLGGRHAR
jgi:hypothetical protein